MRSTWQLSSRQNQKNIEIKENLGGVMAKPGIEMR